MHVIFGISALIMLGGTIWMLAKDHNREWRKWQLDDRARERHGAGRSAKNPLTPSAPWVVSRSANRLER